MAAVKASQLFSIQGLVAVVTGGSSGIGLMIAHALAENGAAKVYIVGRRKDKLDEAAAAYPNIIVPLQGDVTNRESLQSLSATIAAETGYINLLIANAGMGGPGLAGISPRATVSEFVKSAMSTPPADFNAVYGLNCTGVYYTIVAFLELLDAGNKRNTYGSKSQVIATASMASYLRDARYGFAYTSSKAALVSMMKCFATYCVPWSIRFNAIAAGLFPSDLSMPFLGPFKVSQDKDLSEQGALARSYLPAERAGSKEDMAGIVLYLASQAGAYVNGSVMLVDGGKLATVPSTY